LKDRHSKKNGDFESFGGQEGLNLAVSSKLESLNFTVEMET
jgi:hypothetical protein